ncbi:MAG: hypothetical protein Q7R79_01275 [bacterium]|nr:hypothetical protein [bacterium]
MKGGEHHGSKKESSKKSSSKKESSKKEKKIVFIFQQRQKNKQSRCEIFDGIVYFSVYLHR